MKLLTTARESFTAFCGTIGQPLYAWQTEAFGEALRRVGGRFVYPVAGVSAPRGDGKSLGAALVGLWRLVAGPPGQDILSAALDSDGAHVVLNHARTILHRNPKLAEGIDVRASSIEVPATGSTWTVTSREHTASRGRHPNVVIYDEVGWARDDELFTSLLAGQASVEDPLFLIVSTVGRRKSGPLWTVKTLAEGGDPKVFWHWHGTNQSPRVTADFIERQRRILLPNQFAREHQNLWVDAADAFVLAADVDAAMRGTEEHIPNRDVAAVIFVDIGTVHDPSVICLGYEQDGIAVIARLITLQGSHEQPVQIAQVEQAVRQLAAQWRVTKIRVESWQGVSAVQSLAQGGLPAELYAPTAKAHAEEWPLLAQRFTAKTIVLFPHARLREELLGLVYEVGPMGVRVIDRGKVHQDHAVAVRGVVGMLQRAQRVSQPLQVLHFDGGNTYRLPPQAMKDTEGLPGEMLSDSAWLQFIKQHGREAALARWKAQRAGTFVNDSKIAEMAFRTKDGGE